MPSKVVSHDYDRFVQYERRVSRTDHPISPPGPPPPLLRRVDDNVADSPYNYIPTEWICILFVSLFGLSTCKAFFFSLFFFFDFSFVDESFWRNIGISHPCLPSCPLSPLVVAPHCHLLRPGWVSRMERKIVVVAESTPSNALFDPVSPVTYYFVVRLEPASQDIGHDNCPYSVGRCKLVGFLVYISFVELIVPL